MALISGPGGFASRGDKICANLVALYPILFPNGEPLPELRGSRDCAVCVKLFGKTLVEWKEGATPPAAASKEKWRHDPWFCRFVTIAARHRMENGDKRITEEMLAGLERKPNDITEFPTFNSGA